jgi:FtsP/CotA-like multicopper oxidase with cupredoxin domain
MTDFVSTGTEAAGKPVTRRHMLAALGGAGIAAGVAACTASPSSSGSSRSAPVTSRAGGAPPASGSVGQPNEPGSLRIPPLLAPRTDAQGRKVFDLTAEPGTSTFLPGTTTATWGVNGAYLGPTLRVSRGDRVLIHVHNHLPAMTTMHWHGMHLPAIDDGGPHQMIPPGATWSPGWTIDQPATTLWYHPHPDRQTADQVYRGIAGMLIIDDADTSALPLPGRYGFNDIPLIIQDKRLNADGSLDFTDGSLGFGPRALQTGRLGQTILVNGTDNPHLAIGDERVRFRLLNASDARIYNVGFADGRTFDLIATDEGLGGHLVPLSRIRLAPGERAEVVAAFRPGEKIMLRSFPPDLDISGPASSSGEGQLNGGGQSFDLLQVRAAATLRPSPALPARLAALPPPDLTKVTRTRSFLLDGTDAINGQQMDMNRVAAVVIAGSTEIWEVHGFLPHDFHIHGVSFRVIDYAGGPPPPQIAGWKDTVYVPPFQTVRLLVPFGRYADPHHPYMYHCHILQHEDAGMMGQFVVINPGQESQVSVGPAYDGGAAAQLSAPPSGAM